MDATPPLRILLVEDSPDDADLLKLHLQDAGIDHVMQRVDRLPALRDALTTFDPDVVICDGRLPGFVALDAYRVVREVTATLPFVHCPGGYDEAPETLEVERLADATLHKDRLDEVSMLLRRLLKPAP